MHTGQGGGFCAYSCVRGGRVWGEAVSSLYVRLKHVNTVPLLPSLTLPTSGPPSEMHGPFSLARSRKLNSGPHDDFFPREENPLKAQSLDPAPTPYTLDPAPTPYTLDPAPTPSTLDPRPCPYTLHPRP